MTDKMTLLFVKSTGHVLAFVTRESDPETKPKAEELAGEALLVRYIGEPTDTGFESAQFLVPPDELDVEVKDYNDLVVTRPRDFYLDFTKQVVLMSGTVSNVNPSASQISVAVAPSVTEETPVWVQVAGADPTKTQVREGTIESNTSSVDIPLLPLERGEYYVLVLVPGLRAFVKEFTI